MKPVPIFQRLARSTAIPGLTAVALCGLSSPAPAQIHFSVDYRGMTIGTPATGSLQPITEADILAPATPTLSPAYGPLLPPLIFISGGLVPAPGLAIPLHPPCIGHPPAFPCGVEVDALSYGMDAMVTATALPAGTYVFSVDECGSALAGSPLPGNVLTEAPVGDAAADVYQDLGLLPGPLPPVPVPVGHVGIVDGNGLTSPSGWLYPGVGIIEPTWPVAGPTGDDIDAVEFDSPSPWVPGGTGIYFSLDAGFLDPCLGIPNTNSALLNGFLPGMVLRTIAPGAPPVPYAPPPALGLDLMGTATDDLDALALRENLIPGYQPSSAPYDWALPGGPDMLLFSVRRGSAVIGAPDSLFGAPISEADILTTPLVGGLSPFPAIFIAAEWLGLRTTRFGGAPLADLDALDTRTPPQTGTPYCFGTAAACPCGNGGAPGHGCASSAVAAGALLGATGTATVAADNIVLNGSDMTPLKLSLYFQGTARVGGGFGNAINDGLSCAGGGGAVRLGAMTTTAFGTSFYPNPALGHLPVSVRGAIPPAGGTRHYTIWYRDPPSICGVPTKVNYANGFSIVWTP